MNLLNVYLLLSSVDAIKVHMQPEIEMQDSDRMEWCRFQNNRRVQRSCFDTIDQWFEKLFASYNFGPSYDASSFVQSVGAVPPQTVKQNEEVKRQTCGRQCINALDRFCEYVFCRRGEPNWDEQSYAR